MIKITYKELISSINSISKISRITDISISKKIDISTKIKNISEVTAIYEQCLDSLKKKCIKEQEKDKDIVWKDEDLFKREIDELMKKEVNIDIEKIDIADLGECDKLSIGDFSILDWLIIN